MLRKHNSKKMGWLIGLALVVLSLSSWSFAEWTTNENYPLIGDPNAKKGGTITYPMMSYPATFRIYGPDTHSTFNSMLSGLVYQTLVNIHPTTLDFIPNLADSWEIQADNKTFLFRLDPQARWEDGKAVTPDDVVFSWELATDPAVKDPYTADLFGRFEKPEIVDERTVKFVAQTLHWRNFIFCGANLPILPAHIYRGKDYLETFNWDIPNGSGPYKLSKFDKGQNIFLKRRADYWAQDKRWNQGQNNFDDIKMIVIRDQNLLFEKFKKGELDFYVANISKEWVQDMNFDKVQKGWIQKRKVFTFQPKGVQGTAINMRRPPLDDLRARKALAYLFNRPVFMEKLFFNEYLNTYSYFPGSIYENPNNEKFDYDPEKAKQLLEEAGWNTFNDQGILVKDGKTFSVTMLYNQKTLERFLTIYQEDLRKAGIELNLKLLDGSAMSKLVFEYNFELVHMAWNSLIFPNPEPDYHSKYADVAETNNIIGIKDPQIDAILDAYPTMFNVEERKQALQALDGLVYKQYPYILDWYAPFTRVAYWNRFGMPESYFSKTGDGDDILTLWWHDADKAKALEDAMKADTPLPIGETEVHYWQNLEGQK